MLRPHYALAAALLLACCPATWAQIPLTPQAGLLVLRNGQVLEGEVTRAGDYYVVTLGGTSEIRLPAAEVEAVCGSLDEAYDFKVGHLSGPGARPHLELAEWCLRHELHKYCAQQLVAAMRVEPDSPALKQLERRLEFAAQAPKTTGTAVASKTTSVSAEELEQTIRELPRGSVERFSAHVQPILLNRCGANQCHGPNSTSDYKLLRPAAGQIASRRFTQRNLHATLQYLDSSDPTASPLVALPQRRHGTSLTAVFDKQSQKQLDELTAWVRMTLATPQSSAPVTIPAGAATLSQPSTAAAAVQRRPDEAAGILAMKPAVDSGTKPPAPAPEQFVPRDRFDPEIFNRRYHK